jgi:hypothetical protein
MNRGTILMHYDFLVVTYATGSRAQSQFIIRAYVKDGKRWAKFPYLAPQTRMLVVGKACGFTALPWCPERLRNPTRPNTGPNNADTQAGHQ